MPAPGLIHAAGAVVLRRRSNQTQVLLIHRPKYDDWSFPKGKIDRGESHRTAAVREVLEETGVHIRLGPPLDPQSYVAGDAKAGKPKIVHYWVGRVRSGEDVSTYEPNAEVDDVRWVPLDKAERLLTYSHDRKTLSRAVTFEKKTYPLVVVRHAQALSRKRWKGVDAERGLTKLGERQAERLMPGLEAYGVERLVSSSARRCWRTLAPYAIEADLKIEVTDELTEEEATPDGVTDEVDWLVDLREAVAVCSHRPVLPLIFDALLVDPPFLQTGEMVVVHHRDGRIAALERVQAPSGR